jgi:hypothetical protein
VCPTLEDDDGKTVIGPNGMVARVFLHITFKPDESPQRRFRRGKGIHRVTDAVGGAVGGAVSVVGSVGFAARKLVMGGKRRKQRLRDSGELQCSDASDQEENAQVKENGIAPNGADAVVSGDGAHPPVYGDGAVVVNPPFQTDINSLSGTMVITIVQAKKLRAVDSNGSSDPYVKVRLAPGVLDRRTSGASHSLQSIAHLGSKSEKVIYKTKVAKKNLNPVWQESFMLPFEVNQFQKCFIDNYLGKTRARTVNSIFLHQRS